VSLHVPVLNTFWRVPYPTAVLRVVLAGDGSALFPKAVFLEPDVINDIVLIPNDVLNPVEDAVINVPPPSVTSVDVAAESARSSWPAELNDEVAVPPKYALVNTENCVVEAPPFKSKSEVVALVLAAGCVKASAAAAALAESVVPSNVRLLPMTTLFIAPTPLPARIPPSVVEPVPPCETPSVPVM
jgi:hypothetical protein